MTVSGTLCKLHREGDERDRRTFMKYFDAGLRSMPEACLRGVAPYDGDIARTAWLYGMASLAVRSWLGVERKKP